MFLHDKSLCKHSDKAKLLQPSDPYHRSTHKAIISRYCSHISISCQNLPTTLPEWSTTSTLCKSDLTELFTLCLGHHPALRRRLLTRERVRLTNVGPMFKQKTRSRKKHLWLKWTDFTWNNSHRHGQQLTGSLHELVHMTRASPAQMRIIHGCRTIQQRQK